MVCTDRRWIGWMKRDWPVRTMGLGGRTMNPCTEAGSTLTIKNEKKIQKIKNKNFKNKKNTKYKYFGKSKISNFRH
jgi:hypothetical protein